MKFGQKPKEEIVEPVIMKEPVKEEPKDLNSLAFSVTRNPAGGYALVTVAYNPITMLAEVQEVKRVADSREEAEYYFRVAVGNYLGELEARS